MPPLAAAERHAPRPRRWGVYLAMPGLMLLAYLLGALVIYFDLPSSAFLRQAFLGARAWNERRQLPPPVPIEDTPPPTLGAIDKPERTFNGFTLYVCASLTASSTQTFLVNMRGDIVHRWAIPYSKIWPTAPHVPGPVKDELVCFFDCYLYPNGDLLATIHGLEQRANGYGLVKLDKDSNVLWKVSRNIHHDVEVGEDGTIYAIAHKIVHKMPHGLEAVPTPALVDELLVLSPNGEPLGKPIPILEAFRDSPYAPILGALDVASKRDVPADVTQRRFFDGVPDNVHEPLHMNCVRVLPRRLAKQFPNFQPGQVLISLRSIDTIAVLDVETKTVVWAAQGAWRAQHDAQFLDNGHLLIFDNTGSSRGSRVLEYDPRTYAYPWLYPQSNNPPFLTRERGMSQRLPNGNTLIVSSEQGKIWEVTPQRETVWSLLTNRFVHVGRRYAPDRLTFLPRGTHARP